MQQTKRNVKTASVTPGSNERQVREILGNKLSGTHLGLWLLIPEYLRIGAWDLIQGVFNKSGTNDLDSRMAMQLVSESAICVNRVRAKDSLCNQGFSIANGLSMLVRDESIHDMLKNISVKDAESMQVPLLQLRKIQGHYDDSNIFALDPHRIVSSTKRHMPAKKKRPQESAGKMMQNFFCVDAITGQPLAFTIGSSGRNYTKATLDLLELIESASIKQGLFLADKEHFTKELLSYFNSHEGFDILMPAPSNKRMEDTMVKLAYQEKWAGYSIAEGVFQFAGDSQKYRIIAQREGADKSQYSYSAFLTTSTKDSTGLITSTFPKRWTIEEFFNFNGDMGWNRASTLNLNIRYARQSMALIAQAATHGLKGQLPGEYESWTADHLASQVLTNMEGDVRVKDDKIIITYYRDHEALNLKSKYGNISERLVSEGVDPRIPWLYDYKLDFQFK